jgi:hypothetical protein
MDFVFSDVSELDPGALTAAIAVDELEARMARLQIRLRVDVRSFFVFGDALLSELVSLSQLYWSAPEGVEHNQGASAFCRSVERIDAGALDVSTPFGQAMSALLEPLRLVEATLGFYRDKFIIHVPAGLQPLPATPEAMTPTYLRGTPATDAEYRQLRKTLNSIFAREGRPERAGIESRDLVAFLGEHLDELRDPQSIKTAQNLLRTWGGAAPDVAQVATRLGRLVDIWINMLLLVWQAHRRVGSDDLPLAAF